MSDKRDLRVLGRRAALGLLAVVVVVALYFALRPAPLGVDARKVTRGPIEVVVHEDGRAEVKDRYTISAPVSGRLARIALEAGDPVEAGASVAFLLPMTPALLDVRTRSETEARLAAARAGEGRARSAIERAEAANELAKSEADRQAQLFAAGGASAREREQAEFERRATAQDLASARFAARVATHEVRMVEAALGALRGQGGAREQLAIESPVGGRVLRVLEKSEAVVQAGQPLLEVGDPRVLEAVVDVLTTDAVSIEPGDPARLVHWGGQGALDARVRRVEPSAFTRVSSLGVDEQRVNVLLDLTVPHERWAALGDGYRVEADIIVDRADDVLRVPNGALFRRGEGWAVARIVEGVVRITPVEIGRRAETMVEIESGIGEGELVILHPSELVAEGVEVRPRTTP